MEEFAATILAKHHGDVMMALQYLEHCIRACYHHNDIDGVNKFADVRDFIEQHY
jgi:hypothetical protein